MSVVWLTGASTGIGRETALQMARAGRVVAVSARGADKLESLAGEVAGARGSIHPYPLDVTDREAAKTTFEAIEREVGEIALALLAAGSHHPVEAAAFDAGELEALLRINVLGTANCLEPLMKAMIARRRGHIAIVSSVAGYCGLPTAAYYGATKAALINMAEALKFDLDPAGVRLQLIDPGFVRTPLTDKNDFEMPFLMEVEDAAKRIIDGLESKRFEITFPRRFTYMLKLMRCLPYPLYFPLVARGTKR